MHFVAASLSSPPDGTITDAAILLAEERYIGQLAAGASYERATQFDVPIELTAGNYSLVLVTDPDNELTEPGGEDDNQALEGINVETPALADLIVEGLSAPPLTVDNPAAITVGWTVRNTGAGTTNTSNWLERVILSRNDSFGDGDDLVFEYERTGELANEGTDIFGNPIGISSYTRTEEIELPLDFEGVYYLAVQTDAAGDVFEGTAGQEDNNLTALSDTIIIANEPFADLAVSTVEVEQVDGASRELQVSWRVANQGIGITRRSNWEDQLFLASDPDGMDLIAPLGAFQHFGQLSPGGSYDRSVTVTLPDGLSGTYYVVAKTAIQNEFGLIDNNQAVTHPVEIAATPAPDLIVSSVTIPDQAIASGERINVSWAVTNQGPGVTNRAWTDEVYLQKADDPEGQLIRLGSYTYSETLQSGGVYRRTEEVTVPSTLDGLYRVIVQTNANNALYEGSETENNTTAASNGLTVQRPPQPDLQVLSINSPTTIDAGSVLDVSYVVTNVGGGDANLNWRDTVYLSLDDTISFDDVVLGSLTNNSALPGGEQAQYQSETLSQEVPRYLGGEAYIIVQTDSGGRNGSIDEGLREDNNIRVQPILINPVAPADLVVVAESLQLSATETFEGETIQVTYEITNLGAGATDRTRWSDTIWLTRDQNRPSPFAQGNPDPVVDDYLLRTTAFSTPENEPFANDGSTLTRTVTVNLPEGISGNWFIAPWTNALGEVRENTFTNNTDGGETEFDSNNYAFKPITITPKPILQPDIAVTDVVATPNVSEGGDSVTINWTVTNNGQGETSEGWYENVYVTDAPTLDASTKRWLLGRVERQGALGVDESYTQSLTTQLAPIVEGDYIVVESRSGLFESEPRLRELNLLDNEASASTQITAQPIADLRVASVSTQPGASDSGEVIEVTWVVENAGADTFEETDYWQDTVYVSEFPVFDRRAQAVGSAIYTPEGTLGAGERYSQTKQVQLPRGIDGDYYVFVQTNSSQPRFVNWERTLRDGNDNDAVIEALEGSVAEEISNNLGQVTLPVTYREPDLQVTQAQNLTTIPFSGQLMEVTWTVTNAGNRDTRERNWADRIYLSKDAALDFQDIIVGDFNHEGIVSELGQDGDSYTRTEQIRLPDGIEGDYFLLVFTDAGLVDVNDPRRVRPRPLPPADANIFYQQDVSAATGRVPEFADDGNNITPVAINISLSPAPDLIVSELTVPAQVQSGQAIDLSYSVLNNGNADTPPTEGSWRDLIYLSRDEVLDIKSDLYLGARNHDGGLAEGAIYQESLSLTSPSEIEGAYYVFVVTDPADYDRLRDRNGGKVYEGINELNNTKVSAQPILFNPAAPIYLQVQDIQIPGTAQTGQPVEIEWTVQNVSDDTPFKGRWTDAVYLSVDTQWGIEDIFLGRVEQAQIGVNELEPGESYTASLSVDLPPVTPGSYRIIVRPDIFNQVPEAEGEGNNAQPSADSLTTSAPELVLGVPFETTLSTEEEQLYEIEIGEGETLRVALDSISADAANEIFIRYGEAPTGTEYDYTYEGPLNPDQSVIVPSTQAGKYYVLVRGYNQPADNTQTTLLAEALPFSVTDVQTDRGGDGRYVTVDIEGAQFDAGAIPKLVRPGIAEYDPARYEVIDSTRIRAIFDLSDAPHGLYDVKVVNPDAEAILPYRYLVERAIQPDVDIGLSGPRVLAAGESGEYNVSLTSLTNLDTPYVYFTYGVPELGDNDFLFSFFESSTAEAVGIDSLAYTAFSTNLRGAPEGVLGDVPWAQLMSELNTSGQNLAPGYVFDLPTRQFTSTSFSVQTYPGFLEMLALEPNALEELEEFEHERIAFSYQSVISATALTREEFVAQQTQEALNLRSRILSDLSATPALTILAADAETWTTSYLAALEAAGLLRPEGEAPPVRENPLVTSLVSTLSTGLLLGTAGEQIRTSGDLVGFFTQLREWYGNAPGTVSQSSTFNAADFDLALSQPTRTAAFTTYVPYGVAQIDLPGQVQVSQASFTQFLDGDANTNNGVTLNGPLGFGADSFVPADAGLPYTVRFENLADATRDVAEVRVVTQLDSDLDLNSFTLGDLQLGDIQVNIPEGRSTFQGNFDFTASKGFVLRVTAGVNFLDRTANWLLQAIDPSTGEVMTDPDLGLLDPNTESGNGVGFISYAIAADEDTATGTEISSTARVLFNTGVVVDTPPVVNTIDSTAPVSSLTVEQLGASNDYQVEWSAIDDVDGSGVSYVNVYVAEDGGDFKLWQRRTTESSAIFEGEAGIQYEFLALATDNAGNQEQPTAGQIVPMDAADLDLGTLPSFTRTTAPLGQAPEPTQAPSTNELFTLAEQAIPSVLSTSRPADFTQVLRPFRAESFATDFIESDAGIGPMAILNLADGTTIVSGGANRGSLYRVGLEGGAVGNPFATLPYPIFDLAQAADGNLWASTGGGPLLKLDANTGAILAEYGDLVTQSVVIEPSTGVIYLSSGNGVETFDPETETFSGFSDYRVGNLAVAPDGTLWGTSWPERGDVVRFDAEGQPERILELDREVDSIAFGQTGTALEGLLFVSSNNTATEASNLVMVDIATLRQVELARGGSRGDIVETTADGRILLSQSGQVDVFSPALAPQVSFTNPPDDALVALPRGSVTVTFDQDMFLGDGSEAGSALNPANYSLTSQNGEVLTPERVTYNAAGRSVELFFGPLASDIYELEVASQIQGSNGAELTESFATDFTAISDFSAVVDFEFTNTRFERSTQKVSFDLELTNLTDYDLLLPLGLLLEPTATFTSVPLGATDFQELGAYFLDLSDALPDGVLSSGESITGQTISIYNPDALRFDYEPGIFALPTTNAAPLFTSVPVEVATAGQPYEYQVTANDPDGAVLGFLLVDGPDGMSIDSDSGLITWAPESGSASQANVVVQVYDTRGARATQVFTLAVEGGNQAPVFDAIPETLQLQEGEPLTLSLRATDADGQSLTYWADNLPAGAVFDAVTRTLLWTPDFESAGTYEDVRFIVSDGIERSTISTTISVAPVDQAPTLNPVPERTIQEGQSLRLQLSATDPEGAELRYFSNLLPGGATLNPNTGVFEWTPRFFQAGTYEIPFAVTDGSSVVSQALTITVNNVNAAPEFDYIGGVQAQEGQLVRFRAFAFDGDNPGFIPQERNSEGVLTILEGSDPTVTYSVTGLPEGATFDLEIAIFTWIPNFTQDGSYDVTFTATDDGNGTGVSATQSVTVPLIIANTDRGPVIDAVANQVVDRDEVQVVSVSAADPDGDAVVLTANGPTGYSLPDYVTFTDNGDGTGSFEIAPTGTDQGDVVVTLSATTTAVDGNGLTQTEVTESQFVISVGGENRPPLLPYLGDRVAILGQPLSFEILASDFDQEALTFSGDLPSGATLTQTEVNGKVVFTWTPTTEGSYPITLRVADAGNGVVDEAITTEAVFNVVVRSQNFAPAFIGTDPFAAPNQPIALSVDENELLDITLNAEDDDGDTLTYSAVNLPLGATLSPQGRLQWLPSFLQGGTYDNIVVTVTDGNQSASVPLSLTVNNLNQAPVLSPLPTQFGRENDPVQFTLIATDVDRETVAFIPPVDLPTGAVFDLQTGQFEWTPDFDAAGTYSFEFSIEDPNGQRDTQTINVVVDNVNRAPELEVSSRAVALGETLSFTLAGSDLDVGTTLVYGVENLPEGASLNGETGEFSWQPGPGQVGDYTVLFTAFDGESLTRTPVQFTVAQTVELPDVAVELTPSFAGPVGTPVTIAANASGLADIASLVVTVDGEETGLRHQN